MVFRKPYAFLIKHFKLLHLILSALMIYLSVRINLITNLFNKLANDVNVSLDNSSQYVTGFMYLLLFLIAGIAFVVWYLMKNKKKPTKFYLFIIGYYLIIFIFLIVYNSAIEKVSNISLTSQELRMYSDISFLLPLGQYYFIVMAILRGIGFNLKQFNFSKDIKDLEISDEDSEEIEISLSNNNYKYIRSFRKYLRELKYYFFENKYWILIIIGFVLIGLTITFFVNYKFVNNNFSENTFVNASYYNFSVNKTYVVENNLYGENVRKDKKYIIVDLNIKNKYYEPLEIETKNFRLTIGDEVFYNITNKNSMFKDLGLPYDNKPLDTKSMYNYLLIYEIDINKNINKMKLKVFNKVNYDNNKFEYVNINLKPIKLDRKIEEVKVELNKEIFIDEINFALTKININNFDIVNNYEYKYNMCIEKNCNEKTGVIIPNNILKNNLLMLDYNLYVDQENNIKNFIKKDTDFFNTFVSLSYILNGKVKNYKFVPITNVHVKNKVFMEVSSEIHEASQINIIINTRTNKYIYKLK